MVGGGQVVCQGHAKDLQRVFTSIVRERMWCHVLSPLATEDLSICLSVCLSVCLSLYLSIHLSICISVCLHGNPYYVWTRKRRFINCSNFRIKVDSDPIKCNDWLLISQSGVISARTRLAIVSKSFRDFDR